MHNGKFQCVTQFNEREKYGKIDFHFFKNISWTLNSMCEMYATHKNQFISCVSSKCFENKTKTFYK